MRHHYWSCSKFADRLSGTPKPSSGTIEEWKNWKRTAKTKKVRYWLAEEGLDYLQNCVYSPLDLFSTIHHYIDNRWVSKTHALTSNLQRGGWYDFDTRLLHALFDELVNFVEVEQARHHIWCSEEARKKHGAPRSIFRVRSRRCPEAGITHLEWAASLKQDEDWVDTNDPNFGSPTPQALAAQETMVLYKWWKDERPKRPDPMDASGWSDYCEKKRQKAEAADELFLFDHSDSEVDRKASHEILEICRRMEQEQEDEDTEMLIRLIKIRRSLWT